LAGPGDRARFRRRLPAVEAIEQRLAERPAITAPTIVMHGSDNGVHPMATSDPDRRFFTGPYERRVVPGIGHNVPQEASAEFAASVLSLVERVIK
jgi:pimeloyl-ACP methyl ester carboxylesterase